MRTKIIALFLAAGAAVTVCAQKVEVSPVPRTTVWGDKAFDHPSGFSVKGEKDADPQAVAALRKAFPGTKGVKLIIGERGDKSVKKFESLIPAEAEGYYLSIGPKEVVIAGNDGVGTFYGVQSFLQIASQPEVMSVEISDSPTTSVRGVIEGFYGNPWSFADRVSQFDFYGRNKMNIYIYGPKDDPYHHSRWFEPYPEAEAARMKELIGHAADNKVKFVWAMHPSNSITTDDDKQKALDKFQQMYDLGVRAFAIFFDDISAKSVDDQIAYLNFLTDNFVRTHEGVESLIVCPTQYNKLWAGGDYLPKFGKGLYPDIRIMWTGNSVVDMIDREDCEWFIGQTGRKPFIWLNYPVNDYGLHHLLMGPVYGNGTDIHDYISAFCSNPMQYAEASKVALYSIADFAWNPDAYDHDKAWVKSIAAIAPGHEDAFGFFCINNADVGESVHRLRMKGESPEFKAIVDKYPTLTPAAAAEYAGYFRRMRSTADELLADKEQQALIDEIREFIEFFGYQGERGELALALAGDISRKDDAAFRRHYKDYAAKTAKADNLVSRGFEGSIQSVAPRTAMLYVEPFILTTVAQAVNDYKDAGYEIPDGLFPAQVVENGVYYIKANGEYLGNPKGESASETPVLQKNHDEVNPGRQLWIVRLDPKTLRYSITNEWDKRYLTNEGAFGSGSIDSQVCTYSIFEKNGKFAIENDGRGGKGYWGTSDGKITIDNARRKLGDDDYIFEFIPSR